MHSHIPTSRSLLAAAVTFLALLVSSAVATPVDISIAPAVSHLPPTPASGGPVTTIYGTLLPTTEPAVALADRDTSPAPPAHAKNKKKRLDTIEASDGVSSSSSPLTKRSYAASCNSCHMLDFRLLRCGCLNGSGVRVTTTLNLDLCLENNNGVLRWKADGGFSGSCLFYGLTGTTYGIFCSNIAGTAAPWSSVNLNTNIHNFNGVLTCVVPV